MFLCRPVPIGSRCCPTHMPSFVLAFGSLGISDFACRLSFWVQNDQFPCLFGSGCSRLLPKCLLDPVHCHCVFNVMGGWGCQFIGICFVQWTHSGIALLQHCIVFWVQDVLQQLHFRKDGVWLGSAFKGIEMQSIVRDFGFPVLVCPKKQLSVAWSFAIKGNKVSFRLVGIVNSDLDLGCRHCLECS